MAMSTRAKVKNETPTQVESNEVENKTEIVDVSEDELENQHHDSVQLAQGNWEAFREYEQQRLQSIKLLTEEELSEIDQWLLGLQHVYDEIRYPISLRVRQSVSYLQGNEQFWYEQQKAEINDDWYYFCKKLKQHVHDQQKSIKQSLTREQTTTVNNKINKFERQMCSATRNDPSLASSLAITMAREIIKSPTYFSGSKDDVSDWLDILELRFKMANWDDEQKLRYISIHLQDDAYRWWIQASEKIKSWSGFTKAIRQAFGSTKAKELAFEQLRCYKQTVNQSMMQYYDKVIELCRRIDPSMSDAMKLQYLMAGVQESLKLHIALYDPQSTESFLSYARKVEDTLALTNADYESLNHGLNQDVQFIHRPTLSMMESSTNVSHHQPNVCESKLRVSVSMDRMKIKTKDDSQVNSSNHIASKRKFGVCYTCGTPGHHYRDCTRSHFD